MFSNVDAARAASRHQRSRLGACLSRATGLLSLAMARRHSIPAFSIIISNGHFADMLALSIGFGIGETWGPIHPATASECGHSLIDTGYMVLLIQIAGHALHSASLQLLPVPIRNVMGCDPCQGLTFLQVVQISDKLGTWLFQRLELIDAVKVVVILKFALHQEEHLSGGARGGEQTQAALHAFALQQ